MIPTWHVIWTRPGAEHDVAADLREIALAALVPSIRRLGPVNRWARNRGNGKFGKRETVLVPAFPRYLMFAVTAEQPVWQRALEIDGVSAVVRQAGNVEAPARLPANVAATLHGPQGDGVIEDLTATIEEISGYKIGDEIVLTTGFQGIVTGFEGRNVRALLSLFGRQSESIVAPENILEKVA